MEVTVSLGLAVLAGLVTFLSPCVLPLVPSYLSFVTGLTLDELSERGAAAARREAALHAALFVLGFSAVFIALGATASALGGAVRTSLPLMQRVGGALVFRRSTGSSRGASPPAIAPTAAAPAPA